MTLADWIRFYVTIGAIGVLLGIEGLTRSSCGDCVTEGSPSKSSPWS